MNDYIEFSADAEHAKELKKHYVTLCRVQQAVERLYFPEFPTGDFIRDLDKVGKHLTDYLGVLEVRREAGRP